MLNYIRKFLKKIKEDFLKIISKIMEHLPILRSLKVKKLDFLQIYFTKTKIMRFLKKNYGFNG